MNKDKFVLNKLIGGIQDTQNELTLAICFLIDELGYEEVMKMPMRAAFEMINYYDYKAKKEKEANKK